jgi:hypothetical protein
LKGVCYGYRYDVGTIGDDPCWIFAQFSARNESCPGKHELVRSAAL